MYVVFKTVCQISFYAAFIGFSFSSVKDFVQGKSVFQIFQSKIEDLKFPELTFCPRQERSLAYLKIEKLKTDFILSSSEIEAEKIFFFLGRLDLEDYSFTIEESILKNDFLLKKYTGIGVLKNQTEYQKGPKFPIAPPPSASFFSSKVEIPLLARTVKTPYGSCFSLHSEELATIERRYQGWKIKLSSETDWLLYLGSPGSSFPTYSPTLSMRQVTLKKSTFSYISFKPKQYVQLARRGYFDTIDHCKKNINLTDTIRCNKKCYVERLKIDCQPDILNIFDELNLPTCTKNNSAEVLATVSNNTDIENYCRPQCLVPCNHTEYNFQVEDTEDTEAGTTVRINAEELWISGTTEELVHDIPDLLVSVGGFLGLFVGLSLLDVVQFVADWGTKICIKLK